MSQTPSDVPSGVTLSGQQQVEPGPSDVVILQGRQYQGQIPDIFQVLLLAPLVGDPHWNLWYLDVDEEFVLFGSLLLVEILRLFTIYLLCYLSSP